MASIQKLLIANRGEIAVRIIRAAKDAGIGTVAIYADQDRNARHVRLAHEAYALNGQTSAETYLVIDKILSIAKRSGANAIHPGYGYYANYGHNEYYIALGYKGKIIKEYFKKDFNNSNWKINLFDTGLKTMTGGRVKKLKKYLGNEDF